MKHRRRLTTVTNPRGRLDVAAYRIAERILVTLEGRGVRGIREHLLPVIEAAIVDTLPGRDVMNEIPPELQAIFHVLMENRRLS